MTPIPPSLSHHFTRAYTSVVSDFYSTLYKKRAFTPDVAFPDGMSSWEKIPFLTRADIARTRVANRTFVPWNTVGTIRSTSGTSKGGVLVFPRMPGSPSLYDDVLKEARCVMTFLYPAHTMAESLPLARVYAGDSGELRAAARIIQLTHVDTLHGSPLTLLRLCSHLSREAAEHIRILALSMDLCTRLQKEALYTAYPHAQHAHLYGSTEQQGHGAFSLSPHGDLSPITFLSALDFFYEVVDNEGRSVAPGERGELISTSGIETQKALPLIRYRTGDRATLVAYEGTRARFMVHGRATDESIRIPGGIIINDELEQVIKTLYPDALDYRVVVREERQDARVVPVIHCTIITRTHTSSATQNDTERFAAHLRINERHSYLDGLKEGLYGPLHLDLITPHDEPATKQRRLVDLRDGNH